YLMVFTQGALGYGLTSIMGAVVLEIFQGRHYGSIFGTIMLVALAGGAAGPWITGALHDLTGSYTLAFAIGIAVSLLSAIAIWPALFGAGHIKDHLDVQKRRTTERILPGTIHGFQRLDEVREVLVHG